MDTHQINMAPMHTVTHEHTNTSVRVCSSSVATVAVKHHLGRSEHTKEGHKTV